MTTSYQTKLKMDSQVCQLCLELDPSDISLITHKCKNRLLHDGRSVRVSVVWNPRKRQLEEVATSSLDLGYRPPIRPKPPIQLRFGGKFVLCDGKRCHGEHCTYPHSIEERDAWNRELEHDNHHHQQHHQPVPPMSHADWPSLPHMQPDSRHLQPAWNQWNTNHTPPDHRQQIPPRYRNQGHHYPEPNPPLSEVVTTPSHQTGFQQSNFHLQPQQSTATGAISVAKLESFALSRDDTSHDPGVGPAQVEGTASRHISGKVDSSGNDALYDPLSLDNYKMKFDQLVKAERETHEGILRERCNGSYHLTFAGRNCPKGVAIKSYRHEQYKFYAYLDGLSGDNLSYINQASDNVAITNHAKDQFNADIYRQVRSKMLVAAFMTDCSGSFRNKTSVQVQFNLKESYFKDLSNSIQAMSLSNVSRILPTLESFQNIKIPDSTDLNAFLPYFSDEQVDALRTIAASKSHAPPLLLNGAFGTGKSRLLALSTRYFQSLYSRGHPVRILVCTQQRVSADKFLDYYLDCVEPSDGKVFVIREYGYSQLGQLSPDRMNYYKTSKDFQQEQARIKYDNVLLITTCLTAPHLAFLRPGYFSHILIDECSQMREPESVAPLCLADANTKLIFAGDQNQVGPALLVLGDVAQKNGLGISLLQRLLLHYQQLGEPATRSIVTLSRNYRCHSDILKLVDGLFYNCQLSWAENESPPVTHRQYKYPLVFICSDIDTSTPVSPAVYSNEAEIIAERVIEVSKASPSGWPKPPMSHLFIVSPCEEQVARINEIFRTKYPQLPFRVLPDVKSTASIQGRECQAVFLSTTEQIHSDGSSRNPTRSLCDPYVFNTAVTRARSLVIGVGNPFLLLKMEEQVVKQYGRRGKCWSTFFKLCIKNNTLRFSPNISVAQQRKVTEQLDQAAVSEQDALHEMIRQLQAQVLELQQPTASHVPPSHISQVQPTVMSHDNQVQPTQGTPSSVNGSQDMASHHHYNSEATLGLQQLLNISPQKTCSNDTPQHQHNMQNPLQPFQLPLLQPQSPSHEAGLQTGMESHDQELSTMDTLSCHYYSLPNHTNSDIQRVTPTQELISQDQWSPRRNLSKQEEVKQSRYNKESLLGSGGFGVVHHVTEKCTGIEYALKVIHLQNDEDHKKRREVEALTKLKHDGIVEYVDSWEETASADWTRDTKKESEPKMCLFILMELCERDTLKHWLIKNRGENSRKKKVMINYFEQILDALCFIHKNDCIHRDLKPSNIFFSRESEKLKVGDFGLVSFNQPPADTSDEFGNMERPVTGSSYRGAGTFPYISPEQQDYTRRKKVDAKTDIYALGIILFELHYPKKVDEEERAEVFGKVRSGTFPTGFRDQMSKVFGVIKSLTNTRSDRRPSSFEIQNNELINLKKLNKKAKRAFVPVL